VICSPEAEFPTRARTLDQIFEERNGNSNSKVGQLPIITAANLLSPAGAAPPLFSIARSRSTSNRFCVVRLIYLRFSGNRNTAKYSNG